MRGEHVPGAEFGSDHLDLALRHGEAGDRMTAAVDAGLRVAAIEALGAARHDGREHGIGRQPRDLVDECLVGGLVRVERHIAFGHDGAALALDEVAHDAVRFAWIDVVGPDDADARPVLAQQEVRQREDVLVQGGARIEHVLRIFEPLVDRRIPQETVVSLDDRQHRLAAGRERAAENDVDAVVGQQAAREAAVGVVVACRIVADGLDRPASHAARRVDLFDGQGGPEEMLGLGDAADTAAREQHAHAPGLVGFASHRVERPPSSEPRPSPAAGLSVTSRAFDVQRDRRGRRGAAKAD